MTSRQKNVLLVLALGTLGAVGALIFVVMRSGFVYPGAALTATADASCGTPDPNAVMCDFGLGGTPGGDTPTPEELLPLGPVVGPPGPGMPPGGEMPTETALPSPTFTPTLTTTLTPASAAAFPCPVPLSGGLITEMQAIRAAMPGPGSNGFRAPGAEQIAAWELLVQAAARGDLATACTIVQAYAFPYQVIQFTDTPFENAQYVMLREKEPILDGWGTYVFRSGSGANDLIIEAPHPIADEDTEIEAVEFFRKLNARALLVAGTHRCASQAFSACRGTTIACGQVEPYRLSDAAHSEQTMFQATHRTLAACDSAAGKEVVILQLHGNSVKNCPDIFVSNGTTHPGGLAERVASHAAGRCEEFKVDLADGTAGECEFTGGGGPQAVYTNGCGYVPPPDACTGSVVQTRGPDRFISIEQSSAVRQDFDCLLEALREIWQE